MISMRIILGASELDTNEVKREYANFGDRKGLAKKYYTNFRG